MVIQQQNEEFPYIPVAFAEFGIREIPGNHHNPRILEYIRSTDLAKYPSLPDETDWCAAFVNWCVEKVGFPSTNYKLCCCKPVEELGCKACRHSQRLCHYLPLG